MKNFNLSEWALNHQAFVRYLIVLTLVLGVFGYTKLSQSENPPFTFKVMLVQAQWPGATAREMELQVVDRIEKVILETPHVDVVRSFSRPGEANIIVMAKDSAPSNAMAGMFYDIRKRVGDIKGRLPQGVQGPFFNDEFGETYGNIFALTGDGFSYAQLRDAADRIRKELLRVPDVAKILLLGEQDERVFIEFSNAKLANLGFSVAQMVAALQAQNAVVASGRYNTPFERIDVRPDGAFTDLETLRNLPIKIDALTLRLDEVAEVRRGYIDPPSMLFRYQGQDALGIGLSLREGGDIVQLEQNLKTALERIERQLPVGMSLHRVNDESLTVRRAVNEFMMAVFEALVIVIAVSFLSLGMRAGTVVALSIPLVMAATFLIMYLLGVGLHKISLGALILALGLLVDDAIIAVEMMAVKMHHGMARREAASYTYRTMALPMLTGTLITIAGFLPLAMAQSSVGEFTRSIFQVVGIALLLSWFAAVIVIPYLGYHLLADREHEKPRRGLSAWMHRLAEGFYAWFRRLITLCVSHPLKVLLLTVLVFIGSLALFGNGVQKQFFPDATRLELIVDLRLPEGASMAATQREAARLEQYLNTQMAHIDNYATYIGEGSPRFYLPLDQQLKAANFSQFVITTKSLQDREALLLKLRTLLDENAEFSAARGRVIRLENGPPVGYPVQFRMSGEGASEDAFMTLREQAEKLATLMRQNPHLVNVHLDWNELSKVIQLRIDTPQAIALGVTQQALAQTLQSALQGQAVSEFREGDQTIPIMLRGAQDERTLISRLSELSVPTSSGTSVPLAQLARLDYALEDGIIWHRNRTPTMTVRGDIYDGTQAPTVTAQIEAQLGELRAQLPLGYRLETGGAVEESAKGNDSLAASAPVFFVVVLTLLMIQLQSFQRVVMVLLTAPFGIIGVALFLWGFNQPFGFVALLGTIALSGMIMRNSVILVDQIERHIHEGLSAHQAIIESAVLRFRPIMLTALTAILAMIPLSKSVFFGPMAVAIMGGLLVATALTLLSLPALYAVWFKATRGKTAFEQAWVG
ncbi:MAG: multidrug transporter AcrB [Gammaproteobacteria bacterium 28-57-27]|nr:MAG: multidrug transporter AcrB [Gammaproteobacteria bacterium 28-57-27]